MRSISLRIHNTVSSQQLSEQVKNVLSKEQLLLDHTPSYNWGPNISLPENTAQYIHTHTRFKIVVGVVGQGNPEQSEVEQQWLSILLE